jgi:predicted N-acetyltransferase YhbS
VFVNVRKKWRRMGIGSKMVKKSITYANSIGKTAMVYPHDKISKAFYATAEVKLSKKTKFKSAYS